MIRVPHGSKISDGTGRIASDGQVRSDPPPDRCLSGIGERRIYGIQGKLECGEYFTFDEIE